MNTIWEIRHEEIRLISLLLQVTVGFLWKSLIELNTEICTATHLILGAFFTVPKVNLIVLRILLYNNVGITFKEFARLLQFFRLAFWAELLTSENFKW